MASFRTLAVVTFCVVLAVCSKVNQEDYFKLKADMNKVEIEVILGKPTEYSSALDMSSCAWGDEKASISMQYAADKALLFSGQGLK